MSKNINLPNGTPIESVAKNPSQIDLFACGKNGRIYTAGWRSGQMWSDWHQVGHETFNIPPGSPVNAALLNPNELGLFVCGNDGRIYTLWWNSDSSLNWNNTDGWAKRWRLIGQHTFNIPPGSPVNSVVLHSNQLVLIVTGNDGRIYHMWWNRDSGWSGWSLIRHEDTRIPRGSPVTAVARRSNHIDLFMCGKDGYIYSTWHNTRNNQWGRWFRVGGANVKTRPGAPVTAIARSPNHLDLFLSDEEGYVQSIWWNNRGGWADRWLRIAPRIGLFGTRFRIASRFKIPPGSKVAAISRQAGMIDLFASRTNDRIHWMGWRDGEGWANEWSRIDQKRLHLRGGTPISVISRIPDQADLFVCNNDGTVFSTWGGNRGNWANWFRVGKPPDVPSNLRITSAAVRQIGIAWDPVRNAHEYEVEYRGSHNQYKDDNKNRTTSQNSYNIPGKDGYRYRIRVRSVNQNSIPSDWSMPVEVTLHLEPVVSRIMHMVAQYHISGDIRICTHHLNLSKPIDVRTAKLASIEVTGGRATPYYMRFLPQGSNPWDCTRENQGIDIYPGFKLQEEEMNQLYGTNEPEISPYLHIIACKMHKDSDNLTDCSSVRVKVTIKRTV
jgi:hypothetical protein